MKKSKRSKIPSSYVLGIPISIWLIILVITPVILMFIMGFRLKEGYDVTDTFTLANYMQFAKNPSYWKVLLKTFRMSLTVSCCAILLSYPLAYFVSRKMKKFKELLFMLIIIPLWVSYLVRIIAWRTILGNRGLINTLLMTVGLTNEPLKFFLYNEIAVVITLTYIAVPFVFIPLYTVLEKIPKNLLDASNDLGANEFRTFLNVILPISSPGLLTGFMLSFLIALGDYIIPAQLGGSRGMMFGNIVWSQFGFASNWPMGSVMGFVLFFIAAIILAISQKFGYRQGTIE
ncbi:MAG: ABC transporter permease [Spirochaetota bacterium]|nr:MAG: ABC transporter permease [Spirochaetota bacterium]